MILQRIQGEGLMVVQAVVTLIEKHLEPAGKEMRCRIAQEALQLLHFDRRIGQQVGQPCCAYPARACPMHRQPLMGIAEQRAAVLEIRFAEGLQRMLLGQHGQQVTVPGAPAAGQMVTQLPDQHRGRSLAVVPNTPPDPADIQPLAG